MAISTFGVTATKVRNHHFPHISDFSANSNPTSTTVGEMRDSAASELAGKLRAEGLTPSTLEADTASEAYAWCADAIRLGAAIRVVGAMTGQDPGVSDEWERRLKNKWEDLNARGSLALGDATGPTELADGPRSHISHLSLDVGDDADASDAIPTFRRDDAL